MSGDLKDPNRSIPFGTLASIAVGFVVYIGLAVGFAFFINRDLLVNDNNLLMTIAWSSQLVNMRIWGATLSSAMGGLLGGPRILQAISKDKLTPKILGKGFGINNEPRNALIFAFLIAEAGILIGELNMIARIVSMFYIASYGFINIAFALEKWASLDFRPKFVISKWVGIIGFIACFAVMFKLDTLAMVLAFLIMTGIYLLLKKRELRLDLGDVWQSVWSSIVRTSLHKMDLKELEERNWRPNILLFSESTDLRPHLIRIGKDIVGNHGFLSNFDLVENKSARVLFPKHKQSIQTEDSLTLKGIFTRRQSCRDFYEGVEMIARTYGFSGIEPNTVLLNWDSQSKRPLRFAEMVQTLTDLDLNVLMMDFSIKEGFGKYKNIDIWWRGRGNNGNLTLALIKFLWLSDNWRHANVRLLVVNPVNEEKERIQREIHQVIDNLRIQAEIRIINNQVEQRPFYEIIRNESRYSDLVFLGIPELKQGKGEEFVNKTNALCSEIGTVVLVKASSYFKELKVGVKQESPLTSQTNLKPDDVTDTDQTKPEISLPDKSILSESTRLIADQIHQMHRKFELEYIRNIIQKNDEILHGFEVLTNEFFTYIKSRKRPKDKSGVAGIIRAGLRKSFSRIKAQYQLIIKDFSEIQKDRLSNGIQYILSELDNIIQKSPDNFTLNLTDRDLLGQKDDPARVKRFKSVKRILKKISRKPVFYKVRFRQIIKTYIPGTFFPSIITYLDEIGIVQMQFETELQKLTRTFNDSSLNLENKALNDQLSDEVILAEEDFIRNKIQQINQLHLNEYRRCNKEFSLRATETVQQISNHLNLVHPNSFIVKNRETETVKAKRKVNAIPALWMKNQTLLFGSALLEINLIIFAFRIRNLLKELNKQVNSILRNTLTNPQSEFHDFLGSYQKALDSGHIPFGYESKTEVQQNIKNLINNLIDELLRKIRKSLILLPDSLEIISRETMDNYRKDQYNTVETFQVSARRLLDHLIQNELIEPLQELLSDLPANVTELNNELQNINRFLAFSSLQTDHDDQPMAVNEFKDLVKEQTKLVSGINQRSNEIKEKFEHEFTFRINNIEDKLSQYAFLENAQHFKQYVKGKDARSRRAVVTKSFIKFRDQLNRQINQLWYRQSKGILLAEKLKSTEYIKETRINELLNVREEVTSDPDILGRLPFYYKQLFLSKHHHYNDFWVGRQEELEQAEKTIHRYRTGFRGALMVTADHNAGKSFFCQYLANKYFEGNSIFHLSPPVGGSIDPKIFKHQFEEITGVSGIWDTIFGKIPAGSVMIIEDLELWWEKSVQGSVVIKELIQLIVDYSYKCMFIINANIHSYRIINKINNIQAFLLNNIELQPLVSRQLEQIIMLRHDSSNLRIKLRDRAMNKFRSWEYARLFSKYFNYSGGNPGVAMQAWISNITAIDNHTITIRYPRIPDLSDLEMMDDDLFILIIQIILHKKITIEKLYRIYLLEESNSETESKGNKKIKLVKGIEILKRSGIIDSNDDIFSINTNLYPHIINLLIDKEMI